MTRTIQLIISVALLVNIASGATFTVATSSTASATNSAFNTTPTVVLSITNATDSAKWSGIPAANVKYGGNLDGTKIFAYGYTTGSSTIQTITTRTLNATALATSTSDTTEASVIGDAQATGQTFAYTAGPIAQSVPGYLVLAYTNTDGTNKQVYAVAWAGATNSGSKVALTAITPTAPVTGGASTTTTVYDYTPNGVLYEDGVVYVYFVQTATVTITQTSGTAPAPTTTDTVMVQGFYASNGTLFYSAAKAVAVSTTSPTAVVCGLSNITNSTSISCVLSGVASSAATVQYVTVARATGTAGTASTVATSSSTGTSGQAGYLAIAYTPAGILGSNYASGGLVSQFNTTGASSTLTYGTLLYNTTGTAGLVATPIVAPSGATGVISANGFTYPNGYILIGSYATSAAGTTPVVSNYFYAPFYTNGSAISDAKTIASVEGAGLANFFIDVNGSAWFGLTASEKGSTAYNSAGPDVGGGNVVKGTVGKVLANIYPSSTTFGSILSTFFAFLAIVVATLFVF